MNPVANIPVQSLLYQKDSAASHSTRQKGNATQSVFANYAFGPVNTGDGKPNQGSVKPVTGSLTQAVQQAIPWVTQVQASGVTKT